jgi:hypothetical protein
MVETGGCPFVVGFKDIELQAVKTPKRNIRPTINLHFTTTE